MQDHGHSWFLSFPNVHRARTNRTNLLQEGYCQEAVGKANATCLLPLLFGDLLGSQPPGERTLREEQEGGCLCRQGRPEAGRLDWGYAQGSLSCQLLTVPKTSLTKFSMNCAKRNNRPRKGCVDAPASTTGARGISILQATNFWTLVWGNQLDWILKAAGDTVRPRCHSFHEIHLIKLTKLLCQWCAESCKQPWHYAQRDYGKKLAPLPGLLFGKHQNIAAVRHWEESQTYKSDAKFHGIGLHEYEREETWSTKVLWHVGVLHFDTWPSLKVPFPQHSASLKSHPPFYALWVWTQEAVGQKVGGVPQLNIFMEKIIQHDGVQYPHQMRITHTDQCHQYWYCNGKHEWAWWSTLEHGRVYVCDTAYCRVRFGTRRAAEHSSAGVHLETLKSCLAYCFLST